MTHAVAHVQEHVGSDVALPEVYLVEHTIGSIIRSSFRIYAHEFGTMFRIYMLPVLPLAFVQSELARREYVLALGALALVTMAVNYLATAAVTVALSDVCLGNTPTFARSYARVLNRRVLLLFWTAIVIGLVLAPWPIAVVLLAGAEVVQSPAALAATVIAALAVVLVMLTWFMTSAQVVVLEGKGGFGAIRRAKQLGDGLHWRGGVAFALVLAVVVMVWALLGGTFAALFPGHTNNWAFRAMILAVQQGLATPLSLIAITLIYYDRRVRKEAYDARALAEDLAR